MSIYDETGRFGKEAMDGALQSVSAVTRGMQVLASETGDYTKRSYEQSAELLQNLSQTRSLEKAFELQANFAKAAFEGWVAQASKVGAVCSDIAREGYKPFESALGNFPKPDSFKA